MYKTGGFINTELIEPQIGSYEQLKICVESIILHNTSPNIATITKLIDTLNQTNIEIHKNLQDETITNLLTNTITELVLKLETLIQYKVTSNDFKKLYKSLLIIIKKEYEKIKLMLNINCFYKNEKCASLTEFNDLINIFINSTFGIEKILKLSSSYIFKSSSSYIIIQKFGELYVEIESQNIKNSHVEIFVLENNLSLSKTDSIKLDTIKFNNINNDKYVVYNFDKNSNFINAKQMGNKFINVVNNIRQINKDTELNVYNEMNEFIKELCVLLSILYRYDVKTHSYLYDTIQYVDNFFIYLMFINKLDYIFTIIRLDGKGLNIEEIRRISMEQMNEDIEKSKEEIIYSYNYYLYCILRQNYNPNNNEKQKKFVDEINTILNYTKDDIFKLFKQKLSEFIDIVLAVERKFKGLTILILYNFIFNYFRLGQENGNFKISKYKLLTTLLYGEPNYYTYDQLITIYTTNVDKNTIINIYMNSIKLNYTLYTLLGIPQIVKYENENKKTIPYPDCGELTFFNLFNYLLLTDDKTFNLDKLPLDSDIYNFYKKYTKFENLSKRFNKYTDDYDETNIKKEFYKNITDHRGIPYVKEVCEIKPSVETIIKLFNIILPTNNFINFNDIVQFFNKKITKTNEIIYGKENELIKYYFTIDDEVILEFAENHARIDYNNTSSDDMGPKNIMDEYDIVSLKSLYTLSSDNLNIVLLYDDDFYKPILFLEIEELFNLYYKNKTAIIIKYMTKKIINLYFINMFKLIHSDNARGNTILNDNINLLIDIVITNNIIINEDLLYNAILKVHDDGILIKLINKCIKNEEWNLKNMPLLTYALSKKKSIEIIKLLINKFNTVNIVDPGNNMTALMYTVIPDTFVSIPHHQLIYDSTNTIKLIKLLIDNNADINLADVNKMTVLMHALFFNAPPEIIELLIENNADINLADKNGDNVLMYAIKYANPKILKLLIEKKANINFVNKNGNNVLMYAIKYANPKIIKLLIENNADINFVNKNGENVFMYAVNTIRSVVLVFFEIIELLIDKIIITEDVLHYAILNVRDDILKKIITRCIINEEWNLNNMPLLTYAIDIKKSIGIIKLLIDKFNNVNIVDPYNNMTALMYTVIPNNLVSLRPLLLKYDSTNTIELIKLLIDNNADINLADVNKMTVLMHALENKAHPEIIELLIEKNADINLVDEIGNNVLMYAIKYANPKIIKLLIENNADINFVNKNGENVFMYAVNTNRFELSDEIIELLIDKIIITEDVLYYAFLKVPDDILKKIITRCIINEEWNFENMPLLTYAISIKKSIGIIKLLIDKFNTVNIVDPDNNMTALMYTVIPNNLVSIRPLLLNYDSTNTIELIKLLIDNNADINLADLNKMTVLMYALMDKERPEIIELLIEKNADINLADKKGNNVLMYAIKYANSKIIKLLIEKKADINFVNKKGDNVLMYAIKNDSLELGDYVSDEIIELLIDNTYNINLVDKNGNNVLMYAIRYSNSPKIIEKIINKGADINIVNKQGDDVLKYALDYNALPEINQLLIEKKANTVDILVLPDNLNLNLKLKYLKYKNKYIKLKNMIN